MERRHLGLLLWPALAAAAVYAATLGHGFVYDDVWKIQQVAPAAGSFDLSLLLRPRGLTHLVHQLDAALWGDRPFGFHLTNLLLHAVASALAALAARSLGAGRRAALLAGLLFALHPVHVEAVAQFTNRKDLLAWILVALTLVLWRRGTWPAWSGALACLALAVSAKEVAAAAVPVMLVASDLLPLGDEPPTVRDRLRRAALRATPFALAAAVAAALYTGPLARAFRPAEIARVTEGRFDTWSEVAAAALAAFPEQLRLLVFPLQLSADWAPPAVDGPSVVLGAALLLAWVTGVVLLVRRRRPLAAFAAGWVVVTWLPCSNLVPLTPFFVAERYLYVPSFGLCLLFGLAASEALRRWYRPALAVVALGLLLAAGRTWTRSADWASERALWESAVAAGQDTWRVRLDLGNAHAFEGRPSRAVEQFRLALRRHPPLDARRTLVRNLVLAGALGAADEGCGPLLAKLPEDFDCHLIGGEAALARGEREAALRHYRRALAVRPGDGEVREKVRRLEGSANRRRAATAAP